MKKATCMYKYSVHCFNLDTDILYIGTAIILQLMSTRHCDTRSGMCNLTPCNAIYNLGDNNHTMVIIYSEK